MSDGGGPHRGCQGAGGFRPPCGRDPTTFTPASGTQGHSAPRAPVTPGRHWLFPSLPRARRSRLSPMTGWPGITKSPLRVPRRATNVHTASPVMCHTVPTLQGKRRARRSLDSDPLWSLPTRSLGAWGSSPMNLRGGPRAPTSGRVWGAQRWP